MAYQSHLEKVVGLSAVDPHQDCPAHQSDERNSQLISLHNISVADRTAYISQNN